MVQVALTTLTLSIFGIAFLIARRLPDIAAIPVERYEKKSRFSFPAIIGRRIIKFWWELIVFAKRIGLWLVHFSLEKTLRKVRIIALKIENFSAHKLEDMRAHSHDIPHFSFFDDLIKKDTKEK